MQMQRRIAYVWNRKPFIYIVRQDEKISNQRGWRRVNKVLPNKHAIL